MTILKWNLCIDKCQNEYFLDKSEVQCPIWNIKKKKGLHSITNNANEPIADLGKYH